MRILENNEKITEHNKLGKMLVCVKTFGIEK